MGSVAVIPVAPQQCQSRRVESTGRDVLPHPQGPQPRTQLRRGPPSKGEHQDAARVDVALR